MNCRVDLRRLLVIVVLVLWVVNISLAQAGPGGGNWVTFVTSVTGKGDLECWPDAGMATGLAAGDAICQARATAAGLANPSNFVAWISDMNDDAYCRVHNFSGTKAANCGQLELPEEQHEGQLRTPKEHCVERNDTRNGPARASRRNR